MSKSLKILLGVATLWPFAYVIIFFLFVFSSVLFMPGPGPEQSAGAAVPFVLFFALHLLTMVWIMALTVFYIVNVFRNERVVKDQKVLWAVVLFLGNMIAMPIYWYLYIWSDAPPGSSAPPELGTGTGSTWTAAAQASDRRQQYVPPSEPPNWRE